MKAEWSYKGFVDEPIPDDIDVKSEIRKLCKEKNAIILAHYYTEGGIQDIADYVGDSLGLARVAAGTDADIIVMCGVHFMAETNKILCPNKKILLPDLNADCSLARSCQADDFEAFVKRHPDHTVLSYVNTSAAIKTLTDVVVTSGNAKQIVESFPKETKLIFGPDYNLGRYINSITGREMLLWDGGCHVHERFSVSELKRLKESHPDAPVLAHPECKKEILDLADVIGSTAALLKFVSKSDKKAFIIVTESGILHQMKKASPDKEFITAPSDENPCACNECDYMRLNTLNKLYNTLKFECPEVTLPADVIEQAIKPIQRMLEISDRLGL
ncbi:MAG: quinolinate synthase NadA [Porphyromonas sp.]|nr:quinolinate synthase NadA [Porphyromonas sp.]